MISLRMLLGTSGTRYTFFPVLKKYAGICILWLSHLFQEGGFYSAEDADSYPTADAQSKKEGAFYVWTATEIKTLLDKEISDGKKIKLSDIFSYHFNVKESGNVKKYQVRYIFMN